MPKTPPPDWAAIGRRYIETSDAVDDICRDHAITLSALASARKRHGWRRLNPRPFAPSSRRTGRSAPPPSPPPEGDGGGEIVARPARTSAAPRRRAKTPARKLLIDRLVAAISLKLEQLERRMQSNLDTPEDPDATATDHERETRAIGVLIDMRTLSVTSPSAVYSATDQIADFGSLQPTLAVRVAQLSDFYGRGTPRDAIV